MNPRSRLLASATMATVLAVPSQPAFAQGTGDQYIGQLMLFGGNFCPRGWVVANGGLINIRQNTALFSLLGTYYGGNGTSTFGVPDLQGRTPIGTGNGSGLSSYSLGNAGGVESVTLSTSQLPMHTHSVSSTPTMPTSSQAPNTTNPSGGSLPTYPGNIPAYYNGPGEGDQPGMRVGGTLSLEPTGGGGSHENRMPYLTMQWCIATQGVYPSRN